MPRDSLSIRQILYRGAGIDIDMLVSPNTMRTGFDLHGKAMSLLGSSISEGVLEVKYGVSDETAQVVAHTPVDSAGTFSLADLQPGMYSLCFQMEGRSILVRGIEI